MRREVIVRAVLVGLLLGVAVVPARAPCAAAAEACPGCVSAGAASVVLSVPPGTPLAGYGSLRRRLLLPDVLDRFAHAFWFRPHEGTLDPLAARALVLDGGGTRLVWIAVDLLAVDRVFTDDVRRRLAEAGVTPGTLIVSASHTHSGPGAFLDSSLLGAVAIDRHDAAVRRALIGGLVEAARRADGARQPALVGAARVRGPALTTGRLGHPVDPDVVVLKLVAPSGAPIAVLWNYAIHGTMLGPGNLKLSGDVMGAASRQLERELGAPALFVNGALGDVSPRRHGLTHAREDGAALAGAVAVAWRSAPVRPLRRLTTRAARVALPPPFVSLRSCAGRWVPSAATLPLGDALPRDAELIAGALGDTAWVTIPGELQSGLGEAVKRAADAAWKHAFIAGVSNDYLGYFLAPGDYGRVAYVACASLYGGDAGERLGRAAAALLDALAAARAGAGAQR